MKPQTGKTLVGGFVATLILTGIMYWVAPLMLGQPMDVAGMLSGMIGTSWMAGMVIHFVLGTVVFPLLYALIVYGFLPGSPWARGAIWGLVLWLLSELVIVPMAGGGVFHAAMGGAMAAVASLMGHLVYGAVLGGIAGGGDGAAEVV